VAGRSAPPPPLDTSWEQNPGRPLAPKDRAPDFEGIAHTGMRVRLSAFLERPVVVFFYGADKTPAAAAEVRGFRDAWLRLLPVCGMVFGVSSDDRVLHRDFATAEELPFLLIADDGGKIARAFGVPREGERDKATTFIIGKDGAVSHVFPSPSPEAHAAEILAALGAPE
jgi:peroxiredoxin Q/BCP